MKILFLSDANSAHTQRWLYYLHYHNLQLSLWSLTQPNSTSHHFYQSIQVPVFHPSSKVPHKLFYPFYLPSLKKCIQQIKPDIIHAHYASSYGLLASLSHFHPLIISVWGSDIYDFPNSNFLNKKILKFNLSNANIITSTSHCMAQETQKYTYKHIEVIPFGIDTSLFCPNPKRKLFHPNDIVIGTIKTLSPKYGIDTLLYTFFNLKKELPNFPLKLMIVGNGPNKNEYIQLSKQLNIHPDTLFLPYIPNAEIPNYLNELDIYVSLSNSESFGVSAIEAMACELAVVLSNIPAFKEITHNQMNECITPTKNPFQTAQIIKNLILQPMLKRKLGKIGRQIVLEYYDIQKNIQQLIALYHSLV